MKIDHNIKTDVDMVKKLIIFIELLVLLLVIGSSIAVAYTGFSDENKSVDIHKNILTQTESQPKFELAPLNSKFIEYQEKKSNMMTSPIGGHKTGHIPATIDFSYLKTVPSRNTLVSLPALYDLRTLNKVTSVKDQQLTGTCWDFATYGSLESYLMPGQNYYFSEQNMKNLLSSNYTDGFDRGASDVGNLIMSNAYLARWSGPVNNTDDPWNEKIFTSQTGLPIQKHVQNVIYLPVRANATDNQAIKQAIMNYGGVDCSIFYDETSAQNETMTYNSSTHSYYLPYTPSATNHDITLVGWNDNYAASNFSTTPPGNGAFIVKNSWGTSYGDNGYFYMSYYDKALAMLDISAVFTSEPLNDYQNIYQHDPLGWCTSFGAGTNTIWGASVFTARSNETLKAVGLYTPVYNSSYVVSIYNNTGSNPTNASGPVFIQSGTISNSGYNTVPLNSGVQLQSGKTFSVVLKITTPGYNYPLVAQTPISGHSSHSTAIAGESFISVNGTTWTDTTAVSPNTTVCINAFTNSANASPALTIQKSASPTNYSKIGQNITYTYNVTNSGNVNLTGNITVKDNRTGTFNITSNGLNIGNYITYPANYTISQADINAGSVTNLANATCLYNNTPVISANTSATVTASKSSALNIAFSIPTSNLVAGQNATGTTTYTVTPA